MNSTIDQMAAKICEIITKGQDTIKDVQTILSYYYVEDNFEGYSFSDMVRSVCKIRDEQGFFTYAEQVIKESDDSGDEKKCTSQELVEILEAFIALCEEIESVN